MFNQNSEIHIWDLPKGRIFVKLNENFRKHLFDECISVVGGKTKLKKLLNRDINKFISGKYGTSLSLIERMINLISPDRKEDLWEQIECNIDEIRSGGRFGCGRALSIFSPKFPVVLTPELTNFLGHVIADGTIYLKGTLRGVIFYFNNETKLIEKVIENALKNFGGVEHRISQKRRNYCVRFAKVLGIVLEEVIDDLNYFREKISNLMLKVEDKSVISAFLRAVYDDEAHVSFKKRKWTREIVLSMHDKSIIECTHELLTRIGISPNTIREIKYVKMKNEFRERFFDEAWKNGILQKLIKSERRYFEYRSGKRGRFEVLPTIVLVKKICRLCGSSFEDVLDKSELKSAYVFSISSQQNLKKFASLVRFDHPIKKAKLNVLLKSYRFDNTETRMNLLKLLKKGEKSTLQLAKEMSYRIHYVRARLKELEKEGKVICVKNKGYDRRGHFIPYVWKISLNRRSNGRSG